MRERLTVSVRGPGTRADLRWMFAYYLYGWLPCLAVPLWPPGLAVDGVWCGLLRRAPVVLPRITRLADLDARWSQALLKPTAAHAAELRRVERDLRDGAQARLVALSMRVGLAQRAHDRDPEAARRLLADAQDQAQEALTELRHVVRGIHPPIPTDRGLVGAVRALAAGRGLDVTVVVDGLEDGPRAPVAVESAAYFVVAEALTNAAKHSGAGQASVHLERTRTGLRAVIRDSGVGGADDSGGSGLLGMRRRVVALDGTATVSSPVGGPTVIEVELPCVW